MDRMLGIFDVMMGRDPPEAGGPHGLSAAGYDF